MKALKTLLVAVLMVPMAAFMVAKVQPAKAVVNDSLGSLIVLNGLYNSGYGMYGYGGNNLSGLAGLIAVNNATGGGTAGGTGGTGTSLGDLIVLNGLFNNPFSGYGYGSGGLNGLAGLIAVNNLYGGH